MDKSLTMRRTVSACRERGLDVKVVGVRGGQVGKTKEGPTVAITRTPQKR